MPTSSATATITERVHALDWEALEDELDRHGFAVTEPLLSAAEREGVAGLFDTDRFRSTIDMARHRFGEGRYRYFSHPLPPLIADAREAFYERLAPVANRWADRLTREEACFPATHAELLQLC